MDYPGIGFRAVSSDGHTYSMAQTEEVVAFGVDGTNTKYLYHDWKKMSSSVPYQIPSKYHMAFVEVIFSQGQHCGAILPVDKIAHRVDSGFYYTGSTNAAAAFTITASGNVNVACYYGGATATPAAVAVYAI